MQVFSKIIEGSSKAGAFKNLKVGGLTALAAGLAISAGIALSPGAKPVENHLIPDMTMAGVSFGEVDHALLTPAAMTTRDIDTAYKIKKIEAAFATYIPTMTYSDEEAARRLAEQAADPEVARIAMEEVVEAFRVEAYGEISEYGDYLREEIRAYRTYADAEIASYRKAMNEDLSEARAFMNEDNQDFRRMSEEDLTEFRDMLMEELRERVAADPSVAEAAHAELKAVFEERKALNIEDVRAYVQKNAEGFETFAAQEKEAFTQFADRVNSDFSAFEASQNADLDAFTETKTAEIREFAIDSENGFEARQKKLAELEKDIQAIETLLE